jgi:sugar lactone lactonase YvrE
MFSRVRLSRLLLASLSLSLATVLSGCGVGALDNSTSSTMAFRGTVHGGQQGVQNSLIQVYRVGTGGNGSQATAMLSDVIKTDANGFFSFSNDYSCTNNTDQVYITATGGNPGLPAGTNNAALVMVDALGNCSNLNTISYIYINEVTTAAAAWSLAPFMASFDHIGASATNTVGITNAMLGAQQLANPTTGSTATLPSNLTIETGKLYALADALASCVNSDGTTACTPLFTAATPSGGTAPTNILNAALNIVSNPGQNVQAVWSAIPSTPPFPTTLTQAPNDWTMSMAVSGGGLNRPAALGVDALGYVWVVDQGGTGSSALSGFTPQGTPLSTTGFGVGTLADSWGLAIDPSGNIWTSSRETPYRSAQYQGSVTKFMGVASGTPGQIVNPGSPYIYDSTITYPEGLSADTNGDIGAANNANSTITILNSSGVALPNQPFGSGNLDYPNDLAFDQSHGVWVGNYGDSTITHLASNGTLLSTVDCCGAGSDGLAMDKDGNVWSANFLDSSVSEVKNDGTILVQQQTGGGIAEPSGISVDAAQNVWVSNYFNQNAATEFTFSELAGNHNASPAGTVLSPSNGYGLDAPLLAPFGIVPDATGSLWVSSFGNDLVVKFFGLATPTVSPVNPTPSAP